MTVVRSEHCTIWVCVDCMFVHANGECDPDRPDSEPEVWSRVGEDCDVTVGSLSEEHAAGCTDVDRSEGCDCERREFSWSQCEGCGSWLVGSRYAFTLWFEPTGRGV